VDKARRTAANYQDDHVGSLTDTIKIDFASVPNYVRDELAEATLESVRSFLRQPGGREFLDARKNLKKSAALAAAK
jgi:hypothetical protein